MTSEEKPYSNVWLKRRGLLRTTAAGLGLMALGVNAKAAIDPINAPIEKSGVAVELVDFAAPPPTAASQPRARLNTLYHAGDGSNRIFTNDSRGKLWELNRYTGRARLVLDMGSARGARFKVDSNQMGLRSFAFHPDFALQGRPGYRKLYTMGTETSGNPTPGVPVFGGPFTVLFHDVLLEWTATTGPSLVVDPASARELLRIAQYKSDHNADQIVFNPKANPGDADYGMLYLGIGDGGNTPQHTDMYDQAQDPRRALGKIFRIDPLKQASRPYGIPADNPFVSWAGYLPEIWALGLRHPQNICFDPKGTVERMILSDIGQAMIEEVNLGRKGANYGWPSREGPFATNRFDPQALYPLPADDATHDYTYPVAQYDHDEGLAIAGGYVFRSGAVPALQGHYLFGDIVNGRVFHVPVWALRIGHQAVVKELTLKRNGRIVTLKNLVGNSNRVDLRFGQDELGEVYVLTKQDGRVRRMRPA